MAQNKKVMMSGPQHPWYDNSHAPIFILRFPQSFSDGELASALDVVQRWLLDEVDAPFGFIVDMQHHAMIPSNQRRMMADVEKTYVHVDLQYNAAQAIVVPTAITRGIMTAVYWLSPPVYPVQMVATREKGIEWVSKELEKAMVDFPDGPWWSSRKGWKSARASSR